MEYQTRLKAELIILSLDPDTEAINNIVYLKVPLLYYDFQFSVCWWPDYEHYLTFSKLLNVRFD